MRRISLYIEKCIHFFNALTEPRSIDDDDNRHEFILNVLLLSIILLILVSIGNLLFELLRDGRLINEESLLISLIVLAIFSALYILSRRGFFKWSAYILIGILLSITTYAVYIWGVDLPQGLLLYALIIVISGILISTRFAFAITLIVSTTLLVLAYLQNNAFTHPDLYWKTQMLRIDDIVAVVFTLSVIAIVSWLGNREIEKSLHRARQAEVDLTAERDSLEIKVAERTRELDIERIGKMAQIYRLAEFGRLSSGLFHDIINPLTTVSLNIEQVKKCEERSEPITNIHANVDQAILATKKMEGFITSARRQIAKQEDIKDFSVIEETEQIIDILSHKALKSNVKINFFPTKNIVIHGDAIKFNQIALNLISNAIDSYDGASIDHTHPKAHKVSVSIYEENNAILLTVKDHGRGIHKEDIDKIFEPFFTTKKEGSGMGIGLSLVKRIVEKDFNGTISVLSTRGKGTIFKVTLESA